MNSQEKTFPTLYITVKFTIIQLKEIFIHLSINDECYFLINLKTNKLASNGVESTKGVELFY